MYMACMYGVGWMKRRTPVESKSRRRVRVVAPWRVSRKVRGRGRERFQGRRAHDASGQRRTGTSSIHFGRADTFQYGSLNRFIPAPFWLVIPFHTACLRALYTSSHLSRLPRQCTLAPCRDFSESHRIASHRSSAAAQADSHLPVRISQLGHDCDLLLFGRFFAERLPHLVQIQLGLLFNLLNRPSTQA